MVTYIQSALLAPQPAAPARHPSMTATARLLCSLDLSGRLTPRRCPCGKTVIHDSTPVETDWDPTPLTAGDLQVAQIMRRQTMQIPVRGPTQILYGTPPDSGAVVLAQHQCGLQPIGTGTYTPPPRQPDNPGRGKGPGPYGF